MLQLTILPNEEAFDKEAAQRIVEQMKAKRNSVIGLSTGRTTNHMHHLAAGLYRQAPFDISGITLLGIDEVTGVSRDYFGACYTMLKTEIVDGLGLNARQFLMLPTESDDYAKACQDFETEIAQRGGIDLIMLGLGENGHLGFNQPGTPFGQTTWKTCMNAELEERIKRETNSPADRELGGVTLGPKNLMHARRIVLVAKGPNKAEAVRRMLCGPVSEDCPASILQLHPNCEFLLDQAAATLLP